jgi:hypothetical protein
MERRSAENPQDESCPTVPGDDEGSRPIPGDVHPDQTMKLHEAVGEFLGLIVGLPATAAITPLATDHQQRSYRSVYDHALKAINGIPQEKATSLQPETRRRLMNLMKFFCDEQNSLMLLMSDSSKTRRQAAATQETELILKPVIAPTPPTP